MENLLTLLGALLGLGLAHVVSNAMKKYLKPKIKFKKEKDNAIIPQYQTEGAAGFDFHSIEDMVILPGETKIVSTGLSVEVPKGWELQVRCRSSIAAKTSVRLANGVGTVDSDYRGVVGVILHNTGEYNFEIKEGDRVAQGVMKRSPKVEIVEVTELSKSKRDKGGFGSTGK